MIDLDRARRDTPGCERVIHFNNAGAALPPRPVVDAVVDHLRLEETVGGYEAAAMAHDAAERAYDAIAALVGCDADEVALVENATRGWDMAFYSLSLAAGDRILTSAAEYESNVLAFLQVAQRTGARVDVVPSDDTGQISLEALERSIDDRVKLISLTHVPTNGGLVNPAADVGRVARAAGIPFLLDACQSAGQVPLDVGEIGCDMLAATGRKYLRGPRGTGFLYVRRSLIDRLDPPFIDLRAAEWVARDSYRIQPDARRFETWEANVAARIGLGVAVDYALEWGSAPIWERVSRLAESLRGQLQAIPGVAVRDLGEVRCGIVSFTVDGIAPEEIGRRLAAQSINVSVSLDRYTRYDMDARNLSAVVRASVHYYNSEDEVERVCTAIRQMRTS